MTEPADTMSQSYWQLFGLPSDGSAQPADIRKAFFRLALQHHPDRQPPHARAAAAELFNRLQQAYHVLLDPFQRYSLRTAAAAAAEPEAPRMLATGDPVFLALEEARAHATDVDLLNELPGLETFFQMPAASLHIHVGDPLHEAAAACNVQTCDLCVVSSLCTERRRVSLCRTHCRLHLCSAECSDDSTMCVFYAHSLWRHWREDLASAWHLQWSQPDDPLRPNAAFWFNSLVGISEWAQLQQHHDQADQHQHRSQQSQEQVKEEQQLEPQELDPQSYEPPPDIGQAHECSEAQCSLLGFQHLDGDIYVCRASSTLHLCTPQQCRFRRALGAGGARDCAASACWATGRTFAEGPALYGEDDSMFHANTTQRGRSGDGTQPYLPGRASEPLAQRPADELRSDTQLHLIEFIDQRTGRKVQQVVERQMWAGSSLVAGSVAAAASATSTAGTASSAAPLSAQALGASPAASISSSMVSPPYSSTDASSGSLSPPRDSDYITDLERLTAHTVKTDMDLERERIQRIKLERGDDGEAQSAVDSDTFVSCCLPLSQEAWMGLTLEEYLGRRDAVHSPTIFSETGSQDADDGDNRLDSTAEGHQQSQGPGRPAEVQTARQNWTAGGVPGQQGASLKPENIGENAPLIFIGRDSRVAVVEPARSSDEISSARPAKKVKFNVPPASAGQTHAASPAPASDDQRPNHMMTAVSRSRRSRLRRMRENMALSDILAAQALYDGVDAPSGQAAQPADDIEDEETFYGQYVTAALDLPDYEREEELGDYDTMEGIDGGGREAMEEHDEEELELQREAAAQRELLWTMEGNREMRRVEYRSRNAALGEPYGTNAAGGQLRLYEGELYLVMHDDEDENGEPLPAKTARQALRQRAARKWHVLGRQHLHRPPSSKPPPLAASAHAADASIKLKGGSLAAGGRFSRAPPSSE